MKLNYKHSLAAVATAVIVFNFSSCKYEDGPAISLRSKTARLTGEWDVVKLGEEDVSDMDVEMEFEKNGDFSYSISYEYYGSSYSYDINGEWAWGDGKESIELSLDGEDESYSFEIKRLTNSELWMDPEDEEEGTWELEKK